MTTIAPERVSENAKPKADAKSDTVTRNCMMCSTEFDSEWSGERICRKCKSSNKWRSA